MDLASLSGGPCIIILILLQGSTREDVSGHSRAAIRWIQQQATETYYWQNWFYRVPHIVFRFLISLLIEGPAEKKNSKMATFQRLVKTYSLTR